MKKHWHYYFLLSSLFIVGLSLAAFNGITRQLQLMIVITIACAYCILGVFHHMKEHSINLKIVLEYIIIAMLGVSIAFYIASANL